jgi:zinc transport system ATP-binding protein
MTLPPVSAPAVRPPSANPATSDPVMSGLADVRAGPASAALIVAQGLTLGYGAGPPVLRGVDFALMPGEIVTIVGPNGSGKSSFLRGLLGIVPARAGRVTRTAGLRVGYVPQRLHLDPNLPLSVGRFLRLLRPLGRDEAARLLARVGVPGIEARAMDTLSGGQFQRVLLAQALAGNPQLLALDEPTQGLDQPGIAAFYRLIEDVRREMGCAVLSVSHDLHVVMAASDRVICLNGHICCQGTPSVVSAAPEYRALFGFGTGGALALYRHDHDHSHEGEDHHGHDHHGHDHHGHDRAGHDHHGHDHAGHDHHGHDRAGHDPTGAQDPVATGRSIAPAAQDAPRHPASRNA